MDRAFWTCGDFEECVDIWNQPPVHSPLTVSDDDEASSETILRKAVHAPRATGTHSKANTTHSYAIHLCMYDAYVSCIHASYMDMYACMDMHGALHPCSVRSNEPPGSLGRRRGVIRDNPAESGPWPERDRGARGVLGGLRAGRELETPVVNLNPTH